MSQSPNRVGLWIDGWFWLCLLALLLMLWVLSSGFFWMMVDKKVIRYGTSGWQVGAIVYWPMGCAYDKTLLRKPLGMYWHLWAPGHFDRNGNLK